MSIRVIHIPADVNEGLRIVEIADGETAEQLHALTDGWYECVELDDGITLWLNEEGKLRSMSWNARAQDLWNQKYSPYSDVIVGPAVLTGGVDGRGDTLGLSDEQITGIEHRLRPLVRVRIENTYEDGHKSASEVLLRPPADPDDLESWWDDYVFDHTGDGHGIEEPGLGANYEVTVLSGPPQLVGQTHEWNGRPSV